MSGVRERYDEKSNQTSFFDLGVMASSTQMIVNSSVFIGMGLRLCLFGYFTSFNWEVATCGTLKLRLI